MNERATGSSSEVAGQLGGGVEACSTRPGEAVSANSARLSAAAGSRLLSAVAAALSPNARVSRALLTGASLTGLCA